MEKGVFKISDVETKKVERISSKIPDLDTIYGGGFPRGRVSIWSGAPGVGKSRATIHITKLVNSQGLRVMVFQNEVTPSEFKQWVHGQVDENNYFVSNYNTIEEQVAVIREYKPAFVITDSLNMIQGFNSSTKIRKIMDEFKEAISEVNAHAILIGHLNGEGETKGNTDIPHLVDVVCSLKPYEDWKDDYGLVHNALVGVFILSVEKNRYGKSGGKIAFQHMDYGIMEIYSNVMEVRQPKINTVNEKKSSWFSNVFVEICRYIEGKTG